MTFLLFSNRLRAVFVWYSGRYRSLCFCYRYGTIKGTVLLM